jgi:outer membrane immunogenic protein
MKKILATAAVLATVTTAANAADMALKAPPAPPPPAFDWSGWYVGVNGGYSWGRASSSVNGTTVLPSTFSFSTSTNMDGWLGGGQIGYNWQFEKSWLLGVEADIQGTGQRGTEYSPTFTIPVLVAPSGSASGSLAQKLPWFGTVRARLGFEPSDHWLLYATGGLAYGEVDSNATATTSLAGASLAASTSVDNTQVGWTAGAGAEWWLWDRWSAKAEYLYMDLGHVNNTYTFNGLAAGGFATASISSHVTDNIFRVGIDYHFSH